MTNRGWNFHIWECHPTTGKPFKYVGMMNSETEALAWKKKQPRPDLFRILNFGPTALAKGSQTHNPKPKVKAPSGKAAEAMRQAREEALRRDRENSRKRAEEREKREAAKAADRAAMKGIREDAEKIIEQHKADEKADLDAGINR